MRDEPLHPRYRKRATDREKQLGRRYQLVAINTRLGPATATGVTGATAERDAHPNGASTPSVPAATARRKSRRLVPFVTRECG